jgi:hypothetical protein
MKHRKIIILAAVLLGTCSLSAQSRPGFSPFRGFHLGATWQGEVVQKCNMTPLAGDYEYPPVPLNTFGWELGLEISYHFAKYFGVSLGFNYGTAAAWNYKYYMTGGLTLYNYANKPYISEAGYDGPIGYGYPKHRECFFPLKLEFHFPLCRNLYFVSDIGIKIKGLPLYPEEISTGYSATYSEGFSVKIADSNHNIVSVEFFEVAGRRYEDDLKVNVDFVIGAGLYYQMPHGDLLRLTMGANLAFKDWISGYYAYWLHDTYGTFSVRHSFIYAQLSYIHTFNYEKARHWLKRNNIIFESKKDKQHYIFEMLK